MTERSTDDSVVRVFREESSRALATLIRILGDFDAAEEALQDAFVVAVEQWAREGVPANPRAWLVSTARFRAIDRMRRDARFEAKAESIAQMNVAEQSHHAPADVPDDEGGVDDDRLRLIFTCCHPALARDAQVGLTLRTICGLTTDEIARAFL
ncbi:MAG TPA: sigma factor, partial [Gemmatimonadaceae bacterium]|nr:sigma factor [Gemmatimonadaceae bacterium]